VRLSVLAYHGGYDGDGDIVHHDGLMMTTVNDNDTTTAFINISCSGNGHSKTDRSPPLHLQDTPAHCLILS